MLIAFNKPYGVVSQFSSHDKHYCLKDFIDIPNVYPAGRLDNNSEGLLLLTDDGALQARIANPRYKLAKIYLAQVEGIPDNQALAQWQKGIDLGDFTTRPANAKIINPPDIWQRTPPIRVRKTIPDTWLEVTLKEGKNHQVRRMCAKTGYPCLRLVRIQIGRLNLLDLDLPLGQYKEVNIEQVLANSYY